MSLPPPNPPVSPDRSRITDQATEIVDFLESPSGTPRSGSFRPVQSRAERTFHRRTRLSIILFALTTLSVFASGTYLGSGLLTPFAALAEDGRLLIPSWPMLVDGLVFAACVMSILLAHEMGHYLQSRRHGVPATFPFFLPFPINPFGTLGAVIVQDGSRANRKQLFDIAVSGPLAGLVVALPVLWYGVSTSELGYVRSPVPGYAWIQYGDPLLIQWIVQAVHGPYAPGQDIGLNAPLFAGWVGIFITGFNLLPLGQLDGGHILYTLIGRSAHYVAYAVMAGALAWMVHQQRFDYALIVLLLLFFGVKHPPTADDRVPLGWPRSLLGIATLAFIIVGFTPTPIIQFIPYVPISA